MISEHTFASSYASVWHQLAPLSDGYWKIENMLAERKAPPIRSRAASDMRGIVNEAAFRAFCTFRRERRDVDRAKLFKAVDDCTLEAIEYVARLSPRSKTDLKSFDEACRREAVLLAFRLLHFFPGYLPTIVRPTFRGCGLISACEGDVIEGDCLYEIKAGERRFRIIDLRQLLIYAALAYSSGSLSFSKIGLFNPRTAYAWVRTLDQVCQSIAGTRAIDTLSALVSQFSEVSTSR